MLTCYALLALGQVMIGSAKDPLMRPSIPDVRLLLNEWVQQDLGISGPDAATLQRELQLSMPQLRQVGRTGVMPGTPRTVELAKAHAKRLRELSIRAADTHALTDGTVASQVGLSPAQRTQIDGLYRAYFKWIDDIRKEQLKQMQRISTSKSAYPSGPDIKVNRKHVFALRRAVRHALLPGQMAKLHSLMGPPPCVFGSFGWLYAGPSVFMQDGRYLLMNLRVQEELGFTMRQSRLLRESLANGGGIESSLYLREINKLNADQRKRFNELTLQLQGTLAIFRADIAQAIGIDPDVYDEMLMTYQAWADQDTELQNRRTSNNPNVTDMAVTRAERQRLMDKRDRDLLGALSPGQKARFRALKGNLISEIHPPGA